MTAIDFPDSPSTGDSFSAGGKTWVYNGSVWALRITTASRSAYDIAVDNGFSGTEEQWLASLVGADGADGPSGADGTNGADGVATATSPLSYDAGTRTISIDLSNYDTSSEVTQKIADIVNSAPSTLDTLNELAAALGNDPNFATTVTNAIAAKASTGKAIAMAMVFG